MRWRAGSFPTSFSDLSRSNFGLPLALLLLHTTTTTTARMGNSFFFSFLDHLFFLWFTVEKRLDVVVRWFDDKTFSRRIRRLVRCSLSIRFIGRSKWIELVIKKRGKCVGARWQCTQKKTCSVGKSLENHTQNSRTILSSIGAFAGRATRAGAT